MKNVKSWLPVIFLLLGFTSCTSVYKLICSPWQVSEVKFNGKTGVLTPEQLRSIEYQLKNEFDFQFTPDSVYRVIKAHDTIYGTWKLSDDKKILISNINGDEQKSDIVRINKKEFLFHPQLDLGSIEYIRCIPTKGTK
jgi:hypothetical protein